MPVARYSVLLPTKSCCADVGSAMFPYNSLTCPTAICDWPLLQYRRLARAAALNTDIPNLHICQIYHAVFLLAYHNISCKPTDRPTLKRLYIFLSTGRCPCDSGKAMSQHHQQGGQHHGAHFYLISQLWRYLIILY